MNITTIDIRENDFIHITGLTESCISRRSNIKRVECDKTGRYFIVLDNPLCSFDISKHEYERLAIHLNFASRTA